MSDVLSITAFVLSLASVVFTGWQSWTGHQTRNIERARRHDELTPKFTFTLDDISGDRATLRITFTGPDALDALDEVTVVVRDDHPWRAKGEGLGGGPTREQIAQQVWGPYRLMPRVSAGDPKAPADGDGRRLGPMPLPRSETLAIALQRTPAPTWYGGGQVGWQRDYEGKPMRVELSCRSGEGKPWIIRADIATESRALPAH